MDYKIIPRAASLLTYPDDPVKYASSCQITKLSDDRGTIHSLHGADFYALLVATGLKPFKDLGLRIVYLSVVPEHARLIRIALRHQASVTDLGPTTMEGKPMRFIEVALLV